MPNVFQTYDEKDAKALFCTQNVSFILQTSDYSTVSQKILSKCPQLYWRIKEKKLFNCHRLIVIFSPTLAPLQLGRGEYITMTITLWQSYFLGIRRYSVAVNICLISFDLTVTGFWFFLLFLWRGGQRNLLH